MGAVLREGFAERLPTDIETDSANQLRRFLASVVKETAPTELNLSLGKGEVAQVILAPAVAQPLLEVLRLLGSGRGFSMVPLDGELTTQQAADLLNVSRPYLVKLLEAGDIPFTRTGRHRRVKAEDLFAYKDKRDKRRAEALESLAASDAAMDLI